MKEQQRIIDWNWMLRRSKYSWVRLKKKSNPIKFNYQILDRE